MEPRDWLYGLEHFGIKLGLATTRALLSRLGDPQRTFESIHIAGTNGKGSVTAMVERTLREAGYRSARYTSPHLVDLTERFVIDGHPVSAVNLDEGIGRVRTIVDAMQADGTLAVTPTFFEVTTAVAFDLFARAGVRMAVCETGLGGRLDATNVLEPTATAITTIAFDHQQYLGTTLQAIAVEKAGIIKPGVPVVIGALPDEARRVVLETAAARQAPVVPAIERVRAIQAGESTTFHSGLAEYGPLRLGLTGAHQVHNAQVAVAVLETLTHHGVALPIEAVVRGLELVQWPGRLEWRRLRDGRAVLLDAAHNPEGAAALARYLSATADRLPLVFAAMADKDVDGVLAALLPHVDSVVCTGVANPRAADPHVLAAAVRRLGPDMRVYVEPSPPAALERAWTHSARIVAAGSIFLLGDIDRSLRSYT